MKNSNKITTDKREIVNGLTGMLYWFSFNPRISFTNKDYLNQSCILWSTQNYGRHLSSIPQYQRRFG